MGRRGLLMVVLCCSGAAFARGHGGGHHGGSVHVKSTVTKKGSYVPAHERTAPDKRRGNNWSTKGNTNPTTGKAGTKPRDP